MLRKLISVLVTAAVLFGCFSVAYAETAIIKNDTVFDRSIINNDPETVLTLLFTKPVRAEVRGSVVTELSNPFASALFGVKSYAQPVGVFWTGLNSSLKVDGDVLVNVNNNKNHMLTVSGINIPQGILDVHGTLKTGVSGDGHIFAYGIAGRNNFPTITQDINVGSLDVSADAADDAEAYGIYQFFVPEESAARFAVNGSANISAISHNRDSKAIGVNILSHNQESKYISPSSNLQLTVTGPLHVSSESQEGAASAAGYRNYDEESPTSLYGNVNVSFGDIFTSAKSGGVFDADSYGIDLLGSTHTGNGNLKLKTGDISSYASADDGTARANTVFYASINNFDDTINASFGALHSKADSLSSAADSYAMYLSGGYYDTPADKTNVVFSVNGDVVTEANAKDASTAVAFLYSYPVTLNIGSFAHPSNISVFAGSPDPNANSQISTAGGFSIQQRLINNAPSHTNIVGNIDVHSYGNTVSSTAYGIEDYTESYFDMRGDIFAEANIDQPRIGEYSSAKGVIAEGSSHINIAGDIVVKSDSPSVFLNGIAAKDYGTTVNADNIRVIAPSGVLETPSGVNAANGASVQIGNISLTTGTAVSMDSLSKVAVRNGLTADDSFSAYPAVNITALSQAADGDDRGLLLVKGTVNASEGSPFFIDGSSFETLEELKASLPKIIIGGMEAKDNASYLNGKIGSRDMTETEAAEVRKAAVNYTVGTAQDNNYKIILNTDNLEYYKPESVYTAKEGDRVDFGIVTKQGYVVTEVDCGAAEAVPEEAENCYYVYVPVGGINISAKVSKTVYAALWDWYLYGMEPETKERILWLCTKVDHGKAKLMCVNGFEKTPDDFINDYFSDEEQSYIYSNGYYLEPELSEKLMGDKFEHPIIEVDIGYIGY